METIIRNPKEVGLSGYRCTLNFEPPQVVAFGQTTYLAQPYAGGGMQPQGQGPGEKGF